MTQPRGRSHRARTSARRSGLQDVTRTPHEREATKASLKRLADQAEALGMLDPLDVEPAIVFVPEDRDS